MDIAESRWLRAYARWVISHRVLVTLTILSATVFLGSRIGRLQIDSNPNLWAPQAHPYVESTNLLEEIFG